MLETDLLVGTVGWDHDDWVGGFYPQELPEDWRLGYYTNRLRAVLVPTSDLDNPLVDPGAWQDDLYPEFRMVIEWQPPLNADPLQSARAFLQRCAPVDDYVDATLVTLSGAPEGKLAQAIVELAAQRPVCVREVSGEPVNIGAGLPASVANCWFADTQPQPLGGGGYLLALTAETNPRTIRDMIDKIDAWANAGSDIAGAGLFFTGARAADTALQARTIAELMGV